jgi:hypothetical protein
MDATNLGMLSAAGVYGAHTLLSRLRRCQNSPRLRKSWVMAPNRLTGPSGADPDAGGGKASPRVQRPGPTGVEVRLPSLEVFALRHGDFLPVQGRPLSQRELELARPIFGAALRYADVRVVVSSIANAPVTLGNQIRVAEQRAPGAHQIKDATLIHELTHVWQFQNSGMRYVSNSLCHQIVGVVVAGDRNYAYRLTRADVLNAKSIYRLPAEKQARLVEAWFADMYFHTDEGKQGHTPVLVRDEPLVKQMLEEVRAARPLAKSYILEEAAYGPGARTQLQADPLHPEAPAIPWLRLEF